MSPSIENLNLEMAKNLQSLTELIQEALSLAFKGFLTSDNQHLKEGENKTQKTYKHLKELQKLISSDSSLSGEDIASAAIILSHYHKISFDLEKLLSLIENKNIEGILFTEKGKTELDEIFRGIKNLFSHLNDVILTRNVVLIDHILKEKKNYNQLSRKFAQEHEDRLVKGICMAHTSSLYLNILDVLNDILWHLQAIVVELKS
ncbi:MAG: hypothetical protein Q7J85_07625 [Bacillota bacterium]|nr:hypothetical protein [Bacillota bacterium]